MGRGPVSSTLLLLVVALLGMPTQSHADMTVEVPEAAGIYVYAQAARLVTVDFGQPLANVSDLRIHWRGTGTVGVMACSEEDVHGWPGMLYGEPVLEGPGVCWAFTWLPEGAFDSEQSLVCPIGFGFLADGVVQVALRVSDGPADPEESCSVTVPSQAVLEYVALTAVIAVPTTDTSWGLIKELYGN